MVDEKEPFAALALMEIVAEKVALPLRLSALVERKLMTSMVAFVVQKPEVEVAGWKSRCFLIPALSMHVLVAEGNSVRLD